MKLASIILGPLTAGLLFAQSQSGYRITHTYTLGGDGSWDYVVPDPPNDRVFIARQNRVMVVDEDKGSLLGEVTGIDGAHGTAIAGNSGHGFATEGNGKSVTMFDAKTFKSLRRIPAAEDADAIVYDGPSDRVFTLNGDAHSSTVIDSAGNLITNIPLGGKPEYGASAGDGKLYANLTDTNEVVEIDTNAQSFEVATLKRSPEAGADRININLGSIVNRRITFTNASLSDCLKFAYGLVSDEQLAGPDWMKSKAVRYDIVGEAPEGARREDFPVMVQGLVAERLKVRLHHEQRVLSYVALVKGPRGVRMKPAESDAAATTPSGLGRIDTPHMDMQRLATLLSRFERVTVVNETGLTGLYQFRLEWTPDDPRRAGPDAGDAPSLYTAVQEQLGLRLEKRKGPMDVIVVDAADQVPGGN